MRIVALWVLIAALVACGGERTSEIDSVSERAKRDAVTAIDAGDPAMGEAIARARASVDEFLVLLRDPPPGVDRFSVKLALREGGRTEYVWLDALDVEGNRMSGRLANAPRWVTGVRAGQRLDFLRADIVDWLYVDTRSGRMHGNRTTCALLTREPPADADRYMGETGLSCD